MNFCLVFLSSFARCSASAISVAITSRALSASSTSYTQRRLTRRARAARRKVCARSRCRARAGVSCCRSVILCQHNSKGASSQTVKPPCSLMSARLCSNRPRAAAERDDARVASFSRASRSAALSISRNRASPSSSMIACAVRPSRSSMNWSRSIIGQASLRASAAATVVLPAPMKPVMMMRS